MAIDTDLLAATRANMQSMGWGLPDVVQIQHLTGHVNTAEGFVPTYGLAEGFPARYAVLSGQELVRAAQVAPTATVKVTLAANADVRTRDVLTYANEDDDDLALEVVYVVKRARELTRIVYCQDYTLPT